MNEVFLLSISIFVTSKTRGAPEGSSILLSQLHAKKITTDEGLNPNLHEMNSIRILYQSYFSNSSRLKIHSLATFFWVFIGHFWLFSKNSYPGNFDF